MGHVRAKRVAVAVVAATTMIGGVQGTATAAHRAKGGLAPTLSGFPFTPRRERSVRVRPKGVGIRFRAPTTGGVAVVQSFWRGRTAGCEVMLAEDAAGRPGAAIAGASLPDGQHGWLAAPLSGALAAGNVYQLVFRCARQSRARLGYVLDADGSAERAGAWHIDVLHHGRTRVRGHRGSPLFAIVFGDGRWWGQPYRAVGGRPLVRVCHPAEASVTLVPSRSLTVSDVRLPRGARRAGIRFTLDASDGTAMLASPARHRSPRREGSAALRAPVELAAGATYTLHLASVGHRCFRQRALVSELRLGPSVAGLEPGGVHLSHDGGRTWSATAPATLSVRLMGPNAPLAGCGDGRLDSDEQCDGANDAACPGHCTDTCTCRVPGPPLASCGNGALDAGEECDGAADDACPGRCTSACSCGPAPATRHYRSIYGSGYLGYYDAATIGVWPKRLGLMLGEANSQGPLVAPAKALAAATGNGDARFIFYLSLTDMDSRCGCFDQNLYDSFRGAHPDWILKDASGNRVSTSNGIGRLFATDVGNPAYIEAWADWALAAAGRWGWDGVFVDNVFRGYFGSWSATPVNPRTGATYTTADYRSDILAAVRHLRRRFDAAGKMLVGNHTSAWDASTFADQKTRDEVIALGGVEVEDCAYDWNGNPHTESEWIAQLRYLDFANRRGVRTVCSGPSGLIGHASQRDYLLATYLLTKEGFSSVSEINSLSDWWSGLGVDLGAPLGGYRCLDPGAHFAQAADCPSTGKVYAREWERGRVLVNPSGSATVTVPLESDFLLGTSHVRAVTLGPHKGAVLARP